MFSVMKCNFAFDTNWRNTLLVPVEGWGYVLVAHK